jgi:hypothetical protein
VRAERVEIATRGVQLGDLWRCRAATAAPQFEGRLRRVGIDLTDDDRAVIFGLLLESAAILRTDERESRILLWRRRGKRVFEAGQVVPSKWAQSATLAKHPFWM